MNRKTMSNIKQNLFWALGYNTLGIPIAAIGLLAAMGSWRSDGIKFRFRCPQCTSAAARKSSSLGLVVKEE
ncbi:MAG: ATPase [Paenibacillus sp.]|nr:ATPase [Paenibacillus sp.]